MREITFKDVVSGFLVFLIALPLCLGIAMASGFPPVAGVLTAIVGGIFGVFLGSASLTIKGPAAGLIVIVLGAVTELGQGDLSVGYRRALAVGVVAAAIQIVFAWRRWGGLGTVMPPSVVHGMLAAIGVIIIAKQAHMMMGVVPHAKEPLRLLAEIPWSVTHNNPEVLVIGLLSLVILIGFPLLARGLAKRVPPQLLVLIAGVVAGLVFDLEHDHYYYLGGHKYHLGPQLLLAVPDALAKAFVFPDFSMILSASSIKYIVMFALVGTLESTLSVVAVDALDPQKRVSNLDRDLLCVGVGNLVAASIGGLPMISEIVRSKANIDAGAQSRWSNFFHGVFLLLFVALAPALLKHIPLAALAAMLVFVGFRLAHPRELVHVKEIGMDQLVLFVTTLVITLAVDLLVGIAAGVVLKILLHRMRGVSFKDIFSSSVDIDKDGDQLMLRINGAATFVTLLKIRPKLAALDPSVRHVVVDLNRANFMDHTFQERMNGMALEWPQADLGFVGLERLRAVSSHPRASKRIAV